MLIVVFTKFTMEDKEWGAHLEKSSRPKPSFCSWEGSKSRADCELSCTLESTKYFPLSARPRAPRTPKAQTSAEPRSRRGTRLCRSSVCSPPNKTYLILKQAGHPSHFRGRLGDRYVPFPDPPAAPPPLPPRSSWKCWSWWFLPLRPVHA